MKAIEVKTHTNQFGNLELNYPLHTKSRNVRVIILVEDEENEESLWIQSIASNPVFNFLKEDEENIYSLTDGEPIE
jgi:hypothetical protein